MIFSLHPQLAKDCINLGRFELSILLLMNDCQYPWFILVPEVPDIREIFQLSKQQQHQLLDESSYIAKEISALFEAEKMNIAAIGNKVEQLHVHHIVRYQRDKAWPAPVWGLYDSVPYAPEQQQKMKVLITDNLALLKPL